MAQAQRPKHDTAGAGPYASADVYAFGPVRIDVARRVVLRGGGGSKARCGAQPRADGGARCRRRAQATATALTSARARDGRSST
jgi:hypothetical protein